MTRCTEIGNLTVNKTSVMIRIIHDRKTTTSECIVVDVGRYVQC